MSVPSATDQYLYLVGRTPLKEYLEFMARETVQPRPSDEELVRRWLAAQEHLAGLEATEPDWADGAPVYRIEGALEMFVALVRSDPIFQRAFAQSPVEIGVVELARLVVRQTTINLSQVDRISDRFGVKPDPEQIFRLCLPYDHPAVPSECKRTGNDSFEFVSPSNDLRFLEGALLRPEQLQSFQSQGLIAGAAAAVVGYGSNYLNVISAEGRLVLNNGSHRVYTLQRLGVTHAPCVVQKVSTVTEFKAVATGALMRSPQRLLTAPRPPVVKDYFNPVLFTLVDLPRLRRVVRVRWTIEAVDMPEA